MDYVVIKRHCTNAQWLIRILNNGDTEILEKAEEFLDSFVEEPFDLNGTSFFWSEWADKDTWKRVWIDDEQGNGLDTELHYFTDLNKAFDFLSVLNEVSGR